MKNILQEIKRFQKIAGLLKESEEELASIIRHYVDNAYAKDWKDKYGHDYDEAQADTEMESAKSEIIKRKGEEYFELVDQLANMRSIFLKQKVGGPKRPPAYAEMEKLAAELGYPLWKITGH